MKRDNFSVPDEQDIPERLWGHHKYDDKFDKSIPTCVGISRSLKLYAGILIPYKKMILLLPDGQI